MCPVHGLPDSEAAGLAAIFEASDAEVIPADKVDVPEHEPKVTQAKPAGSLELTPDVTPEGIELNVDQYSAVDQFTKLKGGTWKNELKNAWETGDYGGEVDSNLRSQLEQVKVLTAGQPKYIKKLGKAAEVTESVQLDEKTQAIKVLLPNAAWDGKSGPDAYEGHTEGVWVIVTNGDKEKGEGVLVNSPAFDSYKGIKVTDVVKYKSMVASMKPIIFDKIEVEVGDKPKDEPEVPGEEPEVAPDEEPTGAPPELEIPGGAGEEPPPGGPGATAVIGLEQAMDLAVGGNVEEAIERMTK